MKRYLSTTAVASLAIALAACGGNQEAADNTASEPEMNAIMEATSPFGDAEIRMNDAMMKAVGVNAGDNWVRKMIEHHRGAIDISQQLLTMNPEAHVARMAHEAIDKQTKGIAALEKLVAQGQPDPASADLYQPSMDRMHQAMMAANGATLSETYMRKMLEHHRGGVALADVALANGVSGAVRQQVEKTRKMNQDDAKMIEDMLNGKPIDQARTAKPDRGISPAATSATERTARTAAPKPQAKPAPKPAPEPAPKPAQPDDPHAGHVMNNMQ